MRDDGTVPELAEDVQTWWDGVPCEARRCLVEVLDAGLPRAWYEKLVGQRRWAVEVTVPEGVSGKAPGAPGQRIYIDDDGGWGWRKVTAMRGSRHVVSGLFHRVRVVEYN